MTANEPVAYINVEKRCLEWAKPTVFNTPIIAVMDKIPLYTHPVKELTYEDGIEECAQRAEAYAYMSPNFIALAEELRAILRKAQEK